MNENVEEQHKTRKKNTHQVLYSLEEFSMKNLLCANVITTVDNIVLR